MRVATISAAANNIIACLANHMMSSIDLSEEQIGHVALIVKDLERLNDDKYKQKTKPKKSYTPESRHFKNKKLLRPHYECRFCLHFVKKYSVNIV